MLQRRFISACSNLIVTAALCAAVTFPASANEIDRQRELFRAVFPSAELGDWSAFTDLAATDQELLRRYLLWPDLRSTWMRATIRRADPQIVEAFLDQHGILKPARELRYRYALELIRRGRYADYFDIYQSYYQGLDITRLDCLALQAEIETGRAHRVAARARDLWLVGKSQVTECDPAFDYLADNRLLSAADFRRRYQLAVDAREFRLARWLAKSIDEEHVAEASSWMAVQANPERFLENQRAATSTTVAREQMVYALERLTYRDPLRARELWDTLRGRYRFSEADKIRTSRHIALWTARDGLPGAYALLTSLPVAGQNDEVLRWRARTSLRAELWPRLLQDIRSMSDIEQSTEEWRYWYAVALQQTGEVAVARAEFETLAGERSYYGFLAADEVNSPYALGHANLAADDAALAALAARTDLQRARELFLVGQDSRGRSEWEAVVAYFSPGEKRQAAILADRWGWHSRAIATAASIGEYDDLTLRYPLPFRSDFAQHASLAQIPATWAYGIARSESLFMRDIRSSAGAIGLMQLMPATGRSMAREMNLPYTGLNTLTDPQNNIRLGTSYLAKMAARYNGNQVLATAAYNAGPHRVDGWMPEQGSVDARIWIENIPFNETRKYVRRVMSAETIFHWRLTGDVRRLSDALPVVEAPPRDQQVASSQ